MTSEFQGGRKGASQWSSRTRFSSASIVALILFSLPENNSSSTINNSRTNPNAAKTANPNGPRLWGYRMAEAITSGLKPRRFARHASVRPRFPSSLRKGVRCIAANASSRGNLPRLLHSFLSFFDLRENPSGTRASKFSNQQLAFSPQSAGQLSIKKDPRQPGWRCRSRRLGESPDAA